MLLLGTLVLLGLSWSVDAQTASIYNFGCNYTIEDLTWTCDSQTLYFNSSLQQLVPINYTDFRGAGYEVVHLTMDNFHGTIPKDTFATFASRTYTYNQTYDVNGVATDKEPEPTLTFNCDFTYQGFIVLENGSFTGLEFIRHVRFVRCQIKDYPKGSMVPFGSLYSMRVEGGVINNINVYPEGLYGLNIEKVDGVPGSGSLYIDCPILPNFHVFLPIWFAPLENLTTFIWKNQGFIILPSLFFQPFKKLQYFELDDSLTTFLPTTIFDKAPASLGTINLIELDWICSCRIAWWVDVLATLGINWKADQVCWFPNSERGNTVNRFYAENGCIPPPGFDTSRIPKILMAAGSVVLAIISGLAWLPIIPLWEKVMVKSIVLEWGEVPEDAEPQAPPEVDEIKIEINTKDNRDKEYMERKVRAQLADFQDRGNATTADPQNTTAAGGGETTQL